jgi:AmmeMemoRadiSam system protein B
VSQTLPRLRTTLDFLPSPSPENPGVLIRDPYHYSDAMLIVPPVLVECLDCFDGSQTDLDLRATLVRLTGQFEVGDAGAHLLETLSSAGFLEDENFAHMKSERESEFAASPVREPSHAGGAYPADQAELNTLLAGYLAGAAPARAAADVFAIAAPHVSLEGGFRSYAAAYSAIGPEHRDRTFVVLGTSHYGEPDAFGLTRKRFLTPLGEAETDTRLVDWLAERGGGSIRMEDYCHCFEHTIEFQVVFLQHLFGAGVRILPVLCGSFAHSIYAGGAPEDNEQVRRFLDTLGEMAEREGDRLFWVLGVDMAHMGQRYSDPFPALANDGVMASVETRDRARIARISAADPAGFWDLVRENHDDLKWCGSAAFYTFLKARPEARGELLSYEQWNIDENSAVTFAGMAFHRDGAATAPTAQR